MYRLIVRLVVIALLLGPAHTARAADPPKTTVLTVDQNGLAVLGVCYAATPADPAAGLPGVDGCDAGDGTLDGAVVLPGAPGEARYNLTATVIPGGCAGAEPVEFIQADSTDLTVSLACTPGSSQSTPTAPKLDLAAMALRPGDIGVSGWLHAGAFVESLDGQANIHAAYLGRGTEPAAVAGQLIALGWHRSYMNVLNLPSASNPSLTIQRIRSYVTEYSSAEGASAGFSYLEDESWIPSAADVPGTLAFGEQSELTSDSGISSIDGRPYRSLDLTFRTGNLIAGVTLIVFPSKTTAEPAVAMVETLGAILEARIVDSTNATGKPGGHVVRLSEHGHDIATYDDAYYRFDEVDIPLADESSSAATLRSQTYGGATDVYQLWQGVDIGTTHGFLYGVTLLEFPDEGAASAWIGDLQAILGANPFYGDLQPAGDAVSIGDQSVALSYAGGGGSGSPRSMLVAVRIGNRVARIHVVPQGRPGDVPLEPVASLARGQAACLADPACSGIAAIPGALTEAPIVETLAPLPHATPIATPVAATPAP